MAKSYRANFEKREKNKKASLSKERTSFKKSLQKENFDDDSAFANFKPIKRNLHWPSGQFWVKLGLKWLVNNTNYNTS